MDVAVLDQAPEELLEFKRAHYKEIFGDEWEEVYNASPVLDKGENMAVLKDLDRIVGGCAIRKGAYNLRIRGFSILPGSRGKGYAKRLMRELERIAISHHEDLLNSGEKPKDIGLMYLKSLVYPVGSSEAMPVLEFGKFLKRFGFNPYVYNQLELSEEEKAAVTIYERRHQGMELRVFKKPVVDGGVELKAEAKQELLALDKGKWDIVTGGLNWKLGNYGKTGKISYRYDLCPICSDMGSSELNSGNCKKCYIHVTCMEPFREKGRFKEDFEVSNAYFSAMRDFMLAHPPK